MVLPVRVILKKAGHHVIYLIFVERNESVQFQLFSAGRNICRREDEVLQKDTYVRKKDAKNKSRKENLSMERYTVQDEMIIS